MTGKVMTRKAANVCIMAGLLGIFAAAPLGGARAACPGDPGCTGALDSKEVMQLGCQTLTGIRRGIENEAKAKEGRIVPSDGLQRRNWGLIRETQILKNCPR